MPALLYTSIAYILCGNDAIASPQANELVTLAEEKGSALWKAFGTLLQGILLVANNSSLNARDHVTVGIDALRKTGSTLRMPLWLSYLAKASADLGQIYDARRHLVDATSAIEVSHERLFEAEVNRRGPTHACTAKSSTGVRQATGDRTLCAEGC
jgi:hypothetical protein